MTLSPNLINVVADHVMMTVDLRNTNDERLQEAERRLFAFADEAAAAENVAIARR
jgi:N-carbamoyl-L-amino-acid hydrolase